MEAICSIIFPLEMVVALLLMLLWLSEKKHIMLKRLYIFEPLCI